MGAMSIEASMSVIAVALSAVAGVFLGGATMVNNTATMVHNTSPSAVVDAVSAVVDAAAAALAAKKDKTDAAAGALTPLMASASAHGLSLGDALGSHISSAAAMASLAYFLSKDRLLDRMFGLFDRLFAPRALPAPGYTPAPTTPPRSEPRSPNTVFEPFPLALTAAPTYAVPAPAPTYVAFAPARFVCGQLVVLDELLEFNEVAGAAKLNEAQVVTLKELSAQLKQGGGAATPVTAQHVALFSGGDGGAGLLAWPAKYLFPVLDLLRMLLLQPSAAPHVQAAQPPLLPRLAALLGPAADKPATLMVLRCFANALHCAQLRPLAVAACSASAIMDTVGEPIESGPTGARFAACSLLANLAFALGDVRSAAAAAGAPAAGDADALPLQALSVCAHALSVGAMVTQPAQEEALYRVLVALQTLLGVWPSVRKMALEMDLAATLKALPLCAPATDQKITDCYTELLGSLGA